MDSTSRPIFLLPKEWFSVPAWFWWINGKPWWGWLRLHDECGVLDLHPLYTWASHSQHTPLSPVYLLSSVGLFITFFRWQHLLFKKQSSPEDMLRGRKERQGRGEERNIDESERETLIGWLLNAPWLGNQTHTQVVPWPELNWQPLSA